MDIGGDCAPSHNRLVDCWALWSHATPGHGHGFHHLIWRGDLRLGFKPRGELCCSSALMAGMFGHSNQNNGASVALPFIRNGDDLMSSVDLHVDLARNGSKALCGLVIYCHSSVLMTGIKVPLWDLGALSLFGIIAGIRAVMAL